MSENGDASIGLTQVCDTNNSIPANHAVLFVYPAPTISRKQTVAVCVPDPNDLNDPTCVQQCGTAESLVVPPGTAVQYCYSMENLGPVTATKHTLVDDQFGIIVKDLPITVATGGTTFLTRKEPITQNLVNVSTWTASGPVKSSSPAVGALVLKFKKSILNFVKATPDNFAAARKSAGKNFSKLQNSLIL